jgi:uncharacterized cupredoxin-like copper-binding protein
MRWFGVLLTGLAVLLACACGGGAKDVFDDPTSPSKLAVRLDEYKIETKGDPTAAVTQLNVQNTGTATHELKLIRTDLEPDALPRKGADVDESQVTVVTKATDLKRRDRESLDVKLELGSYVLICNVSGHYQLGMRTAIEVK